jgi:hypothetical protein
MLARVFSRWGSAPGAPKTDTRQNVSINRKHLALGLFFLLAGTLEYLVSRPTSSTLFLNHLEPVTSFFRSLPPLYGQFGIYAPAFFHPLAFSLMTMAHVGTRVGRVSSCIAWTSINCLFETAQNHGPQLRQGDVGQRPIDTVQNYLSSGVFDIGDVVAIFLGGTTAYFLGELLAGQEICNDKKNRSIKKPAVY